MKEISVIIPSRDKFGIAPRYLNTVSKSDLDRCEWVVVDTGLSERVRDELKVFGVKFVDYFETYDKFRWTSACNLGARNSSGRILVFCNDDMLFKSDGWVDCLLEDFEDENVGIVAPLMFGSHLLMQYPGTIQNRLVFGSEALGNVETGNRKTAFVGIAPSGAFMVYRRETFEWYDENLDTSDEYDMSVRCLLSNLRILMDSRIVLEHIFGFTARDVADWKEKLKRSNDIFSEKWGVDIRNFKSCYRFFEKLSNRSGTFLSSVMGTELYYFGDAKNIVCSELNDRNFLSLSSVKLECLDCMKCDKPILFHPLKV